MLNSSSKGSLTIITGTLYQPVGITTEATLVLDDEEYDSLLDELNDELEDRLLLLDTDDEEDEEDEDDEISNQRSTGLLA
jgi:hypothetical protein